MPLLEKIAERLGKRREYPSEKRLKAYFKLREMGISDEDMVTIVNGAYSFWGRIFLEPMLLNTGILGAKEEKLCGQDALKKIKNYLNIPYLYPIRKEILEN